MSKDWYQDVRDFHDKFGCAVKEKPHDVSASTYHLRDSLIREEISELQMAMRASDLPGIADAIVDSIYVLLGTAISFGIDIRPCWDLVQAANMAKEGGATRIDGKILKPPGWVAPDIAGELARQGA